MAAILIFFVISSLKPYVGLSCNFVEVRKGAKTRNRYIGKTLGQYGY